ncbi:unnamed protein product [Adineta steineri]|uniref:Uncharacterized protein n=1 Tax=Adineta steineri TaxID=433720 RepID=A0A814V8F4_9BILA|nr:unnamed protein product [Adineta steineri]CAF1185575.1 unnamed protein product [Adineta steineri]
MANIRIFALLLIVMMIINCTMVDARYHEGSISRSKRLFGCAKVHKSCTGVFSKSCCSGTVCNTTIGKCVPKGNPISWLGDRNGK